MSVQLTSVFGMLRSRRPAGIAVAGLRQTNREKGSSIVEFAFVVVVLMTMILGVIDFCRAAYSYHFVSEAAREATRYAAVRGYTCNSDNSCSEATPDTGPATPTNTVVQDYVTSITPSGIDSAKVTTTPNWPAQTNSPASCSTSGHENDPGCTVQVTVSYSFSFLFPLVYKPFSSTGTITLSSSSEMVIVH